MANSVIDSKGRVWLPADVLERLGIGGAMTAEVDASCGVIVIRPVEEVPCEDEWAYTPEHRESVARARKDLAEGRVFQLSEQDLIDYVNGEVAPE
jgi:bifunctional DNA-binding transcriptional regulator/antitoxin component of YhaV-PrlF toxin-antitoxin module